MLGVVVDGVSSYGRAVLRGVVRYANLQRRWVLHKDLRPDAESIRHLPACDGVIVAGISTQAFKSIQARFKHIIFCSGSADPRETLVVSMDDHAAGVLAAEHLIECRLERFAFYGASSNTTVATNRQIGFHETLDKRGFTCIDCPVEWPSGLDWLTHAQWPRLIEWLRQLPKPIGIMAADDSAAHDLSSACLEGNIAVPDHVAIIGVNNDDLLCESAWPPLSSIEADYSRMGYFAAQKMERLFAGETLPADERLMRLPPIGVVQRQSTSAMAVDNLELADAIRFIREHACDPCTVDDVLRHVPVGRRWLERQFIQKLGKTPHDEIVRIRIETAKRLLAETDLSLENIAFRCGFSTTPRFHLVFRQAASTTPAAFRRAARGGSSRTDRK